MTNDRTTAPDEVERVGRPAEAKPLSDGIRTLLKQALGVDGSAPAGARSRCRCDCGRRRCRAPIARTRGDRRVRLLPHRRPRPAAAAGGKSTLDLLRRKDSGVQDAPDAVLLPRDDDEIAAILRYCADTALRSSRSAAAPVWSAASTPIRGDFKAVVSLDLRRLDDLHSLDEVSGEAELGAGLTGPEAERLLGEARASRSATSRRASSSPPSADSRRRDRPARIPRDTAASTTWSAACER